MNRAISVLLLLLPALAAVAASHSAWSDPVAWDAVSPVQRADLPHARPADAGLLISPNPATRGGTVVVRAVAVPAGEIDVFDFGGRLMKRFERVDARGVVWDLRTSSGAPLAPGLYLVRFSRGAKALHSHIFVAPSGGAR
jgi:hypothetical protein